MGKIDKKRMKLQERIDFLQKELVTHLTKKTSATAEVDVAGYQRRIFEMQKKIKELR